MKVAVIGCGTIANAAHIPSYMNNPQVEIKYFCDIIPERAEAAVKQYGVGTAVTDYHQVLADPDIVAVSVCTPNNVHGEISIAAMRAGKNVLCEKPAARTYAEALEMQKVQHETGVILNIGVVNRFNDNVNLIKKYIDSGKLGEVYQVYASFRAHRSIPGLGGAFTTKAIAGGGALIDWGVHYLDIVMYCCGDPKVNTVSAEVFSKLGKDIPGYAYQDMWAGPPVLDGIYDVDDSVTALIRTNGPTITVKQIPQGSDEVTIAVTTESSVGIKYVGWRDSSSKDATYKNNDSFTSLGTTGHAEFTVDKNGWYAIYAENKSSYSNYKVFEVTTIKEDAPKVSLKQVASSSSEVEVTVTATPTISGAVISSLAWRTSSEGANYSSKAGFNNNISLVDKMFKVTSNGWYAVGAEDDKGNFGYKLIEIKSINKGKTMAPVITTTSLPDGTDGVAYSQTLKANGDTPITWSIIGGALPDGLTLNPTTGAITGTPTVVKIFDFTVKAENGTGPDATKDLSIEIVAAPTPIGFTEITYAAGDPAPLAGVIKEGEPTSGYTPPVVTANTGYTVTSAGWISGVDGGDNFDTAPGPAKYTIVLTANSNYAFTGTGLNDTNFATDEATVSIDYNAPTAVLTITYSFAIAAP